MTFGGEWIWGDIADELMNVPSELGNARIGVGLPNADQDHFFSFCQYRLKSKTSHIFGASPFNPVGGTLRKLKRARSSKHYFNIQRSRFFALDALLP